MNYQVLLFYKYITIDNPKNLKEDYKKLCEKFKLKGRTIIAEEGINSTLEGSVGNTEKFLKEFLKDKRFKDIHIKRSRGTGKSFPKLSVKVKSEIVTTRLPKVIDPRIKTAPRISSLELNKWYKNKKDFVVVDMRNSYEYVSGHFKNSIDPGMDASRELPKKIKKLNNIKDKTLLTVCTGGVRCEKMSAYLMYKGFKDVYQLDGGIHSYIEKYPAKNFLGTLYTFDERTTMDFGGKREIVGTCKRCNRKTEDYQNCANAECNLLFLICKNCLSLVGPGFCSAKCEKSPARVVQRVRG